MFRRTTKNFLILFICFVFVVVMAGCSVDKAPEDGQPTAMPESTGPSTDTEKPVTLTLWHYWTTEADGNQIAFSQVLDEFEEDNPNINLEVTGQSAQEYQTKVKVAFAANQAPDILNLQAPIDMEPIATAGKLLSLDDFIAENGIGDRILPGTLNNFTFGDKVYGLPTITAIGILYCNKELFEENDVAYPETFDQLLEAIDAFNENGVTPMMFAGKDLWPTMFYYDILAIRAGGAQLCKDALYGDESFDQPAFIEAAEKLQELAEAGAFKETDLALGWDEGIQKFVQCGAAMLYNGTWVSGIVMAEDSPIKDKVAFKKFPMVEGGAGDQNEFFGGAFEGFSINANVEDKEAAFQAITYLSEQMSSHSLVVGNGLPAWRNEDLDRESLDPLIVEQYDLVTTASDFCLWWDTVLGGEKADIHKSLVLQLLTLKITPEEYAKEMQKLNTGE